MTKRNRASSFALVIGRVRALSVATLFMCGCSSMSPQGPPLSAANFAPPPQAGINQDLASLAALNAASPSADYRVGPEDRLQITLYNIPETDTGGVIPRTAEVVVSQQGKIALPMLGDMAVTGLTSAGLEAGLRERYKKYFVDPQIGVQVKEYRSQAASVIGSVQRPGVFPLSGPKTLIDLLAMAGGVTETAGSQVHLYRQGSEGREDHIFDLYELKTNAASLNVPIQNGDVVNVPKAGTFFVDGAVRKPGSYALDRPYTFSQALATAGGADNSEAKSSAITIYRRSGPGQAETVSIDMNAVLAGKAPDPPIQANDVIFVPTSTTKYLAKLLVRGIGMGFSIPVVP